MEKHLIVKEPGVLDERMKKISSSLVIREIHSIICESPFHGCCGLNPWVPPQTAHVEPPVLSVMVSGGGALAGDEVMRMEPQGGAPVLRKVILESPPTSSSM